MPNHRYQIVTFWGLTTGSSTPHNLERGSNAFVKPIHILDPSKIVC